VADSTLGLEDIDMPDVAALNYFTDKPVLLTTASKPENGLDDFGASDDDIVNDLVAVIDSAMATDQPGTGHVYATQEPLGVHDPRISGHCHSTTSAPVSCWFVRRRVGPNRSAVLVIGIQEAIRKLRIAVERDELFTKAHDFKMPSNVIKVAFQHLDWSIATAIN
jgi:hypothetical protein